MLLILVTIVSLLPTLDKRTVTVITMAMLVITVSMYLITRKLTQMKIKWAMLVIQLEVQIRTSKWFKCSIWSVVFRGYLFVFVPHDQLWTNYWIFLGVGCNMNITMSVCPFTLLFAFYSSIFLISPWVILEKWLMIETLRIELILFFFSLLK